MNQKYIDMIYSENHLEHHGVLGQKWGVENGPPYPLGRDVQSMLSNGASYHSIKKAIRSDAKAAKKEAKTLRNDQKNDLRSRIDKEETRYQSSITNAENKKYSAWDKFDDKAAKAEKDYKEAKKAGDANAKEKYKNTINSSYSKLLDEEERIDSSLKRSDDKNKEAWDKFSSDSKQIKSDYKNSIKDIESAKKAQMKELKNATNREALKSSFKNYEKSEEYINNRETKLKKNISDDDIKSIKNAISNFEKADLELNKLDTGNGKMTEEMKKSSERRDNAYRELENITREIENKKLGDNKDTLLYMALDDKIPEKSVTAKKESLSKALKIAGVAAGVAAVAGVSYLAAKEVSKKLDENDRADKGITRADLAKKLSYGQFKNDIDTHRDSIRKRTGDIASADAANRKYQEADSTVRNVDYIHHPNEYNRRYTELVEAQNIYNQADRFAKSSTDQVLKEKAIIKGNANTPSKKLAASLMDKYDKTRLETANKNSTYNIYNPYYDKSVIKDRSNKSKR